MSESLTTGDYQELHYEVEAGRARITLARPKKHNAMTTTLLEELEHALKDQGGLFGDEPSADRVEEIRREMALEEERVVNEPIAHRRLSPTSTGGPQRR